MTKIYYSVSYDTDTYADGEQYLTGNKEVSIYRIKNNELELLETVECYNQDSSENVVTNFLNEEGFEDVELILL